MVFHCMYMKQFVFSVIYWWIFRLFPVWGYYKTRCYENSCTSLFMDIYFLLSVEGLDHMVGFCLISKEIAELFSKVVVPLYSSANSAWMFQLLHILIKTSYVWLVFHFRHSEGCVVVPHYGFNLHFPYN